MENRTGFVSFVIRFSGAFLAFFLTEESAILEIKCAVLPNFSALFLAVSELILTQDVMHLAKREVVYYRLFVNCNLARRAGEIAQVKSHQVTSASNTSRSSKKTP